MIPENLVELVHGPVVIIVGTCDSALKPTMTKAMGAMVDPAQDIVTVFIPDCEGGATLANLADSGRIAVTVADGLSHECYQFKGAFLDSRATDEREQAIQDIYREKLVVHFLPMGIPDSYFRNFITTPSTAVRFKVEDIFVQTPGPGAGEAVAF